MFGVMFVGLRNIGRDQRIMVSGSVRVLRAIWKVVRRSVIVTMLSTGFVVISTTITRLIENRLKQQSPTYKRQDYSPYEPRIDPYEYHWCAYVQRVYHLWTVIYPHTCPACNRQVYRTAGHHWKIEQGEPIPVGEF